MTMTIDRTLLSQLCDLQKSLFTDPALNEWNAEHVDPYLEFLHECMEQTPSTDTSVLTNTNADCLSLSQEDAQLLIDCCSALLKSNLILYRQARASNLPTESIPALLTAYLLTLRLCVIMPAEQEVLDELIAQYSDESPAATQSARIKKLSDLTQPLLDIILMLDKNEGEDEKYLGLLREDAYQYYLSLCRDLDAHSRLDCVELKQQLGEELNRDEYRNSLARYTFLTQKQNEIIARENALIALSVQYDVAQECTTPPQILSWDPYSSLVYPAIKTKMDTVQEEIEACEKALDMIDEFIRAAVDEVLKPTYSDRFARLTALAPLCEDNTLCDIIEKTNQILQQLESDEATLYDATDSGPQSRSTMDRTQQLFEERLSQYDEFRDHENQAFDALDEEGAGKGRTVYPLTTASLLLSIATALIHKQNEEQHKINLLGKMHVHVQDLNERLIAHVKTREDTVEQQYCSQYLSQTLEQLDLGITRHRQTLFSRYEYLEKSTPIRKCFTDMYFDKLAGFLSTRMDRCNIAWSRKLKKSWINEPHLLQEAKKLTNDLLALIKLITPPLMEESQNLMDDVSQLYFLATTPKRIEVFEGFEAKRAMLEKQLEKINLFEAQKNYQKAYQKMCAKAAGRSVQSNSDVRVSDGRVSTESVRTVSVSEEGASIEPTRAASVSGSDASIESTRAASVSGSDASIESTRPASVSEELVMTEPARAASASDEQASTKIIRVTSVSDAVALVEPGRPVSVSEKSSDKKVEQRLGTIEPQSETQAELPVAVTRADTVTITPRSVEPLTHEPSVRASLTSCDSQRNSSYSTSSVFSSGSAGSSISTKKISVDHQRRASTALKILVRENYGVLQHREFVQDDKIVVEVFKSSDVSNEFRRYIIDAVCAMILSIPDNEFTLAEWRMDVSGLEPVAVIEVYRLLSYLNFPCALLSEFAFINNNDNHQTELACQEAYLRSTQIQHLRHKILSAKSVQCTHESMKAPLHESSTAPINFIRGG